MSRAVVLLVALTAGLLAAANPAEAAHFPSNAPAVLLGGLGERAPDSDGDGLRDSLLLDVPVRVSSAGTYVVNGTLRWAGGDGSVIRATATSALAAGEHAVTLVVPGGLVANRDGHHNYDLNVTLRKENQPALVDWYEYRTGAHRSSEFELAPAKLTRAPVVYPVDEGGDGRADALAVDFLLAAPAPTRVVINFTLSEAATGIPVLNLPGVEADLPAGGSIVSTSVPRTALRTGHIGAYVLDAVVRHVDAAGASSLADVARVTTDRVRVSAFADDAPPRLGAADAGPAGGRLATHGLAVIAPVMLGDAYELTGILADPTTGASAAASAGTKRYATGDNATLAFGGADALAVVRGSDAPAAYHWLLDGSGFVVAGGRTLLLPRPVVTFSVSPPGPVSGEVVTFAARATGLTPTDTFTYEWDFGTGFEPGGAVVTRTYAASREYPVAVRATNAYGVSGEDAGSVTVALDVAPVLGANPEWRPHEGEVGTYDVRATDPNGRPITVLVRSGPSGLETEGARLRWTPPTGGPDEWILALAASDGRLETPFSLTVRVQPPRPPELPNGTLPNGTALGPTVRAPGGVLLEARYAVQAGAPFELDLEGFDPAGGAVNVTVEPLPDGAFFRDGKFRWISPTPGSHRFYANATAGGVTGSHEFVVDAVEPPPPEGATEPTPEGDGGAGEGEGGEETPSPGLALGLAALAAAALARRSRRA